MSASAVLARAGPDSGHSPSGLDVVVLEAGGNFRFVVHQASGMVAAQLEIGVGEALVRLRAYAFANDRSLSEVAEDVVARRLRLE